MVSLTDTHGFLDDCNDTTGWTETENNCTAALSVVNNDYLKLTISVAGAPSPYVYYEKNIDDILANSFPYFMVRYKTELTLGVAILKAKVELVFDDATTQPILTESSSETFTVAFGTPTAGKTIDKIRLYAITDPAVTGSVYFDFVLLCRGTFTLPNISGGMDLDPRPRSAFIGIPSKITDLTQNLGSESAIINLSCDLDQGNWKRDGDLIDGEVFLDIEHNRKTEPWQWVDTGMHQFKVSVDPKFRWVNNGDGSTSRFLDLVLTEYSLGDKGSETYRERFGMDL